MHPTLPLFAACLLLLTGCGRPEATSASEIAYGTAANPRLYERFSDLAPLFNQTDDTTYVINFWATWCAPCREEIPLLQRLAEDNAARPLRVVLVSLDDKPEAIARIPAFLQAAAPSLPAVILTDPDPAWGKTIDRVWSGELPTTIIYRGDLRYVYRRNFPTYVDLSGAVAPLLR